MDAFGIAGSGMQAASSMLGATANNLANSDSPGYRATRVDMASLQGGGVTAGNVSQDRTPGPIQPDGKEGSNVDPAREAINLTRAKVLYSANAAVYRMADRMTGTLLDVMDTNRRDHKS
ncbi:MAG TPA: flagellar basal body rod C-terminal domain-containing protein [Humisphaera sp.]|jgi:flagellar basal body rod protein FlgG|nr:flagellar basal body rod C-terminal domain-containing protein [Humisphaera sp.]